MRFLQASSSCPVDDILAPVADILVSFRDDQTTGVACVLPGLPSVLLCVSKNVLTSHLASQSHSSISHKHPLLGHNPCTWSSIYFYRNVQDSQIQLQAQCLSLWLIRTVVVVVLAASLSLVAIHTNFILILWLPVHMYVWSITYTHACLWPSPIAKQYQGGPSEEFCVIIPIV